MKNYLLAITSLFILASCITTIQKGKEVTEFQFEEVPSIGEERLSGDADQSDDEDEAKPSETINWVD